MNAKKQVSIVGLAALAFGLLALPAMADYVETFRTYDLDHDGRWDYREFHDANRGFYMHHPDAYVLNDRALRHEFRRLDRDGDGFIRVEDVRRYRNW